MEKDILRELKKEKEVREPIKEKIGEEVIKERREWAKEKEREFLTEKEKTIREKLEEETAKMELSPELEKNAREKAEQLKGLDEQGKVTRLLDLAEEKGLSFTVGVARDMNDPYTLDILHDILARNELYKRFSK